MLFMLHQLPGQARQAQLHGACAKGNTAAARYFLPELLGVCWRFNAGRSGMFFESILALTLALLALAFSATAC